MKLYLVNYWMPFPSSEYGGLQCVIAKDDASCVRILAELVYEYYAEKYPDYEKRIKELVAQAKSYELAGDHEEGVVEEFTT